MSCFWASLCLEPHVAVDLTLPCSTSTPCCVIEILLFFQNADGTYTVTYEHISCTETIPADSDEDNNFDAHVQIGWYAEREEGSNTEDSGAMSGKEINTWRILLLNLKEDKTNPEPKL